MGNTKPTEIFLPLSLEAWSSNHFKEVLGQEIQSLGIAQLPLQQGLRYSSMVAEKTIRAMVLSVVEVDDAIKVKAAVLFSGVVAGCSCADDPTPIELIPEQCELVFVIDKETSKTRVWLVDD